MELLLKEAPPLPFPKQYLEIIRKEFENTGFTTLEAQEAYGPIRFYDVGALVWFARVIPWEFPKFNVQDCVEQLYRAQEILESQGVVQGRTHRFLLCVRK